MLGFERVEKEGKGSGISDKARSGGSWKMEKKGEEFAHNFKNNNVLHISSKQ